MVEQYAAHLRFHYRISPRQWETDNYTEKEILEWWFEYFFVKEQLGEISKEPKK